MKFPVAAAQRSELLCRRDSLTGKTVRWRFCIRSPIIQNPSRFYWVFDSGDKPSHLNYQKIENRNRWDFYMVDNHDLHVVFLLSWQILLQYSVCTHPKLSHFYKTVVKNIGWPNNLWAEISSKISKCYETMKKSAKVSLCKCPFNLTIFFHKKFQSSNLAWSRDFHYKILFCWFSNTVKTAMLWRWADTHLSQQLQFTHLSNCLKCGLERGWRRQQQ